MMHRFTYRRAESIGDVDYDLAHGATILAGGTTLLDLMKLDVMRPTRIVDINQLGRTRDLGEIDVSDTRVRLGALVRMSDAADHSEVRSRYPMLVQSLELAASQQLRNMATLGGNVLQRTRCPYFRDTSWEACNKRAPGSGCAAMDGFNRMHAVLGISDACIATYPGDFAQALMALDASVELIGPRGSSLIRFSDLHELPEDTPHIETALGEGEMIAAFTLPIEPWFRRSAFVKVRDRESYEFALASAAVALQQDGDRVAQARIALGGVATIPWRAREAEAELAGKTLNEETAIATADIAFAEAVPLAHNAYKIELGKATLVRALLQVQAMEI